MCLFALYSEGNCEVSYGGGGELIGWQTINNVTKVNKICKLISWQRYKQATEGVI